MSNGKSGFEEILKWVVIVILAIAALKVAAVVLSIAWITGAFLLFRVLPLVIVVWFVYKLIQWLTGSKGSSSSSATMDI